MHVRVCIITLTPELRKGLRRLKGALSAITSHEGGALFPTLTYSPPCRRATSEMAEVVTPSRRATSASESPGVVTISVTSVAHSAGTWVLRSPQGVWRRSVERPEEESGRVARAKTGSGRACRGWAEAGFDPVFDLAGTPASALRLVPRKVRGPVDRIPGFHVEREG